MGWVTYGSSRLILVGLGNLRFLQVVSMAVWRRWQKSGSTVMAAVAMMMMMKTKVTAAEVAA